MSRIVSIITFYNPTHKCVDNALRILNQSDLTIICDNSGKSNVNIIDNINCNEHNDADYESQKNVIAYRPFHENLGLSAAFNRVLFDQSFDWNDDDLVLFFDQDSVISENYIQEFINEFINLENKKVAVGCLGPFFFDTSTGTVRSPKLRRVIDKSCISVNSIITSSMLVRYRTLRQIHFWNEQIFLDMADWDLCWRIKAQGLLCIMTDKVILHHSVGDGIKKIGGLITLDVGKSFREYYQTRDCLYLLKKSYVPIKNKIRFILQVTLRPILHIMFLKNKRERAYYIKLGIKHYLQGITGALKKEFLYTREKTM